MDTDTSAFSNTTPLTLDPTIEQYNAEQCFPIQLCIVVMLCILFSFFISCENEDASPDFEKEDEEKSKPQRLHLFIKHSYRKQFTLHATRQESVAILMDRVATALDLEAEEFSLKIGAHIFQRNDARIGNALLSDVGVKHTQTIYVSYEPGANGGTRSDKEEMDTSEDEGMVEPHQLPSS